jgi:hypothetical protein
MFDLNVNKTKYNTLEIQAKMKALNTMSLLGKFKRIAFVTFVHKTTGMSR